MLIIGQGIFYVVVNAKLLYTWVRTSHHHHAWSTHYQKLGVQTINYEIYMIHMYSRLVDKINCDRPRTAWIDQILTYSRLSKDFWEWYLYPTLNRWTIGKWILWWTRWHNTSYLYTRNLSKNQSENWALFSWNCKISTTSQLKLTHSAKAILRLRSNSCIGKPCPI